MSARRLIVMRHAKSSWSDETLSDHERPLSPRGRRDAPRVARSLQGLGWMPDAVIASDSARTLETWARMRAVLGEVPLQASEDLYLAGPRALWDWARRWDQGWRTVLTLGHNPGWSALASQLAGEGMELTTANAALFEAECADWASAAEADWRLVEFIRPAELEE